MCLEDTALAPGAKYGKPKIPKKKLKIHGDKVLMEEYASMERSDAKFHFRGRGGEI